MRQLTALGLLGIPQQGAGSGDRHGGWLTETGQILYLKLLTQLAAGGVFVKLPAGAFAGARALGPAAWQTVFLAEQKLRR